MTKNYTVKYLMNRWRQNYSKFLNELSESKATLKYLMNHRSQKLQYPTPPIGWEGDGVEGEGGGEGNPRHQVLKHK